MQCHDCGRFVLPFTERLLTITERGRKYRATVTVLLCRQCYAVRVSEAEPDRGSL